MSSFARADRGRYGSLGHASLTRRGAERRRKEETGVLETGAGTCAGRGFSLDEPKRDFEPSALVMKAATESNDSKVSKVGRYTETGEI